MSRPVAPEEGERPGEAPERADRTSPGREDCPPAPASRSFEDLGFRPRPMVSWFHPKELARTGAQAALSGLFGEYADQREVQAALVGEDSFDFSEEGEIWIDYVADLGDGFDPTYAVARLLAAEELVVEEEGGRSHRTRRGRALVFGGDQVYPSASPAEYRDRLVGPYRAALPCVSGAAADPPPALFAIPGNHDWYDGLTSFTRLFSQQRWIGGWKTRQTRSYFALRLPHDWWLWGIDVQLESDVDLPQVEYFRRMATEEMEPGSRVILCTAEPSWVYAEMKGEDAYRNLRFFEDSLIRANGHRVAVGLAGDLHTYARYEDDEGDGGGGYQRFVSGGGGAYLYPTHDLPDSLKLPAAEGPSSYRRRASFPDVDASRSRVWGALRFPLLNWWFGGFLAVFYLWFAWVTESVSAVRAGATGDAPTFLDRLAAVPFGWGGFWEVVSETWILLIHSPGSVFVVALLTGGLMKFADAGGEGWRRRVRKILMGGTHAAAHLVLVLLLMWGFASFNLGLPGIDSVDDVRQVVLFGIEMFLFGGLLGGGLFGVYLVAANRLFGRHSNEVFTCQSIPDYKNVLRLHLDADGGLTIYPIGIPTVPRTWTLRSDAGPGEAWFEPADDGEDGGRGMADRAVLIEEPVRIPGRSFGEEAP